MLSARALDALEQGISSDGALGDDFLVRRQFAVKDGVGEIRVELDEPLVLFVDEVLAFDVGGYDGSELGSCEEGAVVDVALVAIFARAAGIIAVEYWRELLLWLEEFDPP